MPSPKETKMTAEEYFKTTPEDSAERYELINGELTALAAPSFAHQLLLGQLFRKISDYIDSNKGSCVPVLSPFDVMLDEYNVVQPDISIICDRSKIDDKRCNGAPDWIIELTSSNRSNDFTRKLTLYAESKVREYWIVDLSHKKVVVYFFDESDSPNIYTFDTNIPVGIYDGKLTINISELI